MSKYGDLDEAILGLLRGHDAPLSWMQIFGRLSSRPEVKDWRVIDRRIQALRRAGMIRYERRGYMCLWSLS